jgi:hypothetical protein
VAPLDLRERLAVVVVMVEGDRPFLSDESAAALPAGDLRDEVGGATVRFSSALLSRGSTRRAHPSREQASSRRRPCSPASLPGPPWPRR